MAACWMDEASPCRTGLRAHLASCADCRAEMARFSGLWETLGDLPAPEPSDAAAAKWLSVFETLVAAQDRLPQFTRSAPLLSSVGASVGGRRHMRGRGDCWRASSGNARRARSRGFRNELTETRRVAALSLLRQQTAAEQLRGIGYTAQLPELDPDVAAALLDTIARDSSVNVRLAAIEALNKASANAGVLASLTRALTRQDSPLVQAALIDYLAEARDRSAVSTLRLLIQQPDLNPAVRDRTQDALRQLTQ